VLKLELVSPIRWPKLQNLHCCGNQIDNGCFGIINIHALTEELPKIANTLPISYDGENKEGRVSRRGECWTPVSALP